MNKYLIVIDMQNDFITGSLGTKEAQLIVPKVVDKVREYKEKGYTIIFTQDTHNTDYLETQEGLNLPIPHCIKCTTGWQICNELLEFCDEVYEKETFGSIHLVKKLTEINKDNPIDEIELCGLCTDICVISNALLIKAFLPEVKITVDASCCAGTTPESHKNALEVMKVCQVNIINSDM
ncbi:MAG: cysteine hydrolase [Clostridiaceae bacterium]|nr:cysteine hydrolase [Clostridiaceae bacterium]